MKYCSQCGSEHLVFKIPEGDNRERQVCEDCGCIHYLNPKVVAGAILSWENRILLARRDIEPRRGLWTLPAGFMELGETLAQAAARESWEEALAKSRDMQLYGIFSLAHISQVYVIYRGTLDDGKFGVGQESCDAALFAAEDIPWTELAFPIVEQTLKRFLKDRELGHFEVFEQVIEPGTLRR